MEEKNPATKISLLQVTEGAYTLWSTHICIFNEQEIKSRRVKQDLDFLY